MNDKNAIVSLRSEVLAAMDSYDLMSDFLNGTKASTREQYRKNLKYFFEWAYGQSPSPELVANLMALEQPAFNRLVGAYIKEARENQGLTEATVNNRVAALSSLLKFSRVQNLTTLTTEAVNRLPVQTYRDTSGLSLEELKLVFAQCDRSTRHGRRNYALLRLLLENALRRAEVSSLNNVHFDKRRCTLEIKGKGRNEREFVTITPKLVELLVEMVGDRDKLKGEFDPLFVTYRSDGTMSRLSPDQIYKTVRKIAQDAGIDRIFSPHRMRHTSVTTYLDISGGDVRSAQALSRHKDGNTLAIYDDHRKNLQGGVSQKLSELLDEAIKD